MRFLPPQMTLAVLTVLASAAGTVTTATVANAETAAGLQPGESMVAAKFRDGCDGTSDVQLPNPYQADLVFQVNGERVVVPPQQRPWHTAAAGRNGVIELQILRTATGAADTLTHVWAPPGTCTGTGDGRRRGGSRLSVEDNGLAAGDSIVAARFRDGCDGTSDVQLPNPTTAELVFDVNGVRVAVGPQLQPWHSTVASGHRRNRYVDVVIERANGLGDAITHVWAPPAVCPAPVPPKA